MAFPSHCFRPRAAASSPTRRGQILVSSTPPSAMVELSDFQRQEKVGEGTFRTEDQREMAESGKNIQRGNRPVALWRAPQRTRKGHSKMPSGPAPRQAEEEAICVNRFVLVAAEIRQSIACFGAILQPRADALCNLSDERHTATNCPKMTRIQTEIAPTKAILIKQPY